MTEPVILLCEDEKQMRRFVHLALSAQGYKVVDAENGTEALQQAAAHVPDLVLLDLGLPDMDGLEVVTRLREWYTGPIIIVTARETESEKVKVLDGGADDYITKPFGAEELSARIRVALRRTARSPADPKSAVMTVGNIKLDLGRRLVFVNQQEVHVTPIEYKLLTVLMKHVDKVLTHKQLLDQVWGPGHAHQMQYLRVYMTQLRRKLEENPARPRHLVTEPGVGYRLRSE